MLLYLLLLSLVVAGMSTVTANRMQSKLLTDLLDDYQAALKPRCGANGTTVVDMDVAFRQILDLDEPKQVIDCIIWIRLMWNDCRLTWNSTDYDGITSITLPHNKAWVPDITLYDSAQNKLSGVDDYKLVIHHDGTIMHNFPSVIKSICSIDVTHFPFDYQVCTLTFGSWVYPLHELDIRNTNDTPDTTAYVANGEWRLTGARINRKTPGFGSDSFALIMFVIQLQRRPLFYVLNLLFPCMLITLTAILGFLLPTVSGEKVHIEITLMVSFALFQLIVLDLMPHTGQTVPFIGLYFLVSMLLVGMSVLMTVVVLNIHFKGARGLRLPGWLRSFVLHPLARVFRVDESPCPLAKHTPRDTMRRVSTYGLHRSRRRVHSRPRIYSQISTPIRTGTGAGGNGGDEDGGHIGRHRSTSGSSEMAWGDAPRGVEGISACATSGTQTTDIVTALHRIADRLAAVEDYLEDRDDAMVSEWVTFAIVLDRLFATLYILFLLVSSTVLSIKYIYFSEMPES